MADPACRKVIAADGGAEKARGLGLEIVLLVGDLDSGSPETLASVERFGSTLSPEREMRQLHRAVLAQCARRQQSRSPRGGHEAVRAHHLRYTQCFLYHLAPKGWGLCSDEFIDTGGWPHQLYVRDARRMVGEYVLRERDLVEARVHDDVVALGTYNIDVPEIERTWRYFPEYAALPAVFNEGYLSVAVRLCAIPYRCPTPKREHAADLLVPVCLSASHVAFASVRMEPTFMLLGHAAGLAAAQAVRSGVAVQDVDVAARPRTMRSRRSTYPERFDALLTDIRALGFESVDLWGAHLNPDWATDAHLDAARESLACHRVRLSTYAAWVGPSNADRACELALASAAPVSGGGFSGDPERIAPALERHGVRLAIENHPQRPRPTSSARWIAAGAPQ